MMFRENRLPADDSRNFMSYLLFLKKRQNLKLSSAANYRCRFKGFTFFPTSKDICHLLSHFFMLLDSLYCKQYGPR